jgi:hypothetical protein
MPERLAPNPWLVKWTHAEIDAGADIIVMHGAPLLHGVEIYRGRPIFYDLGNFIYNVPPTLTYIDEPMSWESLVATVRVEGKAVKSISLRPVVLNPIGDGQPDVHNPYTSNEFLHTRGLPTAATGRKSRLHPRARGRCIQTVRDEDRRHREPRDDHGGRQIAQVGFGRWNGAEGRRRDNRCRTSRTRDQLLFIAVWHRARRARPGRGR